MFYAHHKAKQLLIEVQRLEAGKTTIAEVKRIVQRFGGEEYDARSYYDGAEGGEKHVMFNPCLGGNLSYGISVGPPAILVRAIQKAPTLHLLGWHPWYVGVTIDHKEGNVTCYSERVLLMRPDGQYVQASANFEQRNAESLVGVRPYEARSFVSRRQSHATQVIVLPEASAEEKYRAFRMDISCIASFGGCVYPCQLSPLVWLDSVRDRQSHGWELPEGADDPRCPAH
jgi:hypothetical protein